MKTRLRLLFTKTVITQLLFGDRMYLPLEKKDTEIKKLLGNKKPITKMIEYLENQKDLDKETAKSVKKLLKELKKETLAETIYVTHISRKEFGELEYFYYKDWVSEEKKQKYMKWLKEQDNPLALYDDSVMRIDFRLKVIPQKDYENYKKGMW